MLGARFVVATDTGEVVGYAMGGRNREGGVELLAHYVLPERQGARISRRFWPGVTDHCRGLGFTEPLVWAPAGDGPGRRFSERQGVWTVLEREVRVGEDPIPEVGDRAVIA